MYLRAECGVLMSNLINSYILFADDLILCSEMSEGLQRLFDGLYQYCSNRHIILSLTKTKVMIFNGRKINQYNFTFNDNLIESLKEYKYVGAIFSTNSQNAFKINSSHLIEKATRAIFGLQSHIKDDVRFLPLDLSV